MLTIIRLQGNAASLSNAKQRKAQIKAHFKYWFWHPLPGVFSWKSWFLPTSLRQMFIINKQISKVSKMPTGSNLQGHNAHTPKQINIISITKNKNSEVPIAPLLGSLSVSKLQVISITICQLPPMVNTWSLKPSTNISALAVLQQLQWLLLMLLLLLPLLWLPQLLLLLFVLSLLLLSLLLLLLVLLHVLLKHKYWADSKNGKWSDKHFYSYKQQWQVVRQALQLLQRVSNY